jgi:hypothetical protein
MTVFFPPRAWASIIRRRCDVRVHVYIYTQFAICWKVYCQLEATDTAQTTVGASAEGLDVLPSWITKLRPSLIRTVEATNPEPPPRFGVVYVTFLRQTAKRSGGLITTRGILPKLNSAIRSVGLHAHEGFFSSSFRSNRKKTHYSSLLMSLLLWQILTTACIILPSLFLNSMNLFFIFQR